MLNLEQEINQLLATPPKITPLSNGGLLEQLELLLSLPPEQRVTIIQILLRSINIHSFYTDLSAELETAYLSSSPAMLQRLQSARTNQERISFEVVREKLRI